MPTKPRADLDEAVVAPDGSATLYNKAGEAVFFRYSVDAREALVSGDFTQKKGDSFAVSGESVAPVAYGTVGDSHVPDQAETSAPQFKSSQQMRDEAVKAAGVAAASHGSQAAGNATVHPAPSAEKK